MLSVSYPGIIPLIADYPIGLMALRLPDGEGIKLIVKASKEYLLTAEMNNGFKVYVAPLDIEGEQLIGLISAFFDDEDAPLVIRTPLFRGDDAELLRQLLLCESMDVHLFDENSRELLAFKAALQHDPAKHDLLAGASLPPFDYASARSADDQMVQWFGMRSQSDDLAAISFVFGERIIPKDIFRMEFLPETHTYHGGRPTSFTTLVREEPGYLHERDIVYLLSKIFSPKQIFLNPLQKDSRQEVCDILVVSESVALFIQAKDSPNTESILRNTLIRKKAATEKAMVKAVSQMRGAIRYALSENPMKVIVGEGGQEFEIDLAGMELRGLIVVKELFNDRFEEYSQLVLPLSKEASVPCIPLDYYDLVMYAAHLRGEEAFYGAFDRVYSYGAENGLFPRLRLGLMEAK